MTTALERRYRDTLRIAGAGMIVLGIWAVMRNAVMAVVYEKEINLYLETSSPFLMTMVPAFLELAARLFVGLGARAESQGSKKGSAYLVVAGLLAVAHLVSIVAHVAWVAMKLAAIEDVAAFIVIDATCLYLTLDLIVSAVRLRRLEREAR